MATARLVTLPAARERLAAHRWPDTAYRAAGQRYGWPQLAPPDPRCERCGATSEQVIDWDPPCRPLPAALDLTARWAGARP